MADLQRGLPNFFVPPVGFDASTFAPAPPPAGFGLSMPASMPSPDQSVPVAPAPVPASGFGNLFTGQYPKVLADPNASAFSSYLAQSAQDKLTQQRATILGTGPSNAEKLIKGIFGTQDDWKNITDRDQAANVLSHPLAQQHLVNNPDHLAAAEKDPVAYIQTPEFQQSLQQAVAAQTEAQNNPKIHPDDHPEVVNKMLATGANAAQVHGSMAPHQYTRDEFIRVVSGMPMKTAQMLFGAQLAHVLTPQQQATNDYLKELRAPLEELAAKYNAETDVKIRRALYDQYTKGHQYMMNQLSGIAKGTQLLPPMGQEQQ